MNRSGEVDPGFFEKLWRATYRRARRPVEGVLVAEEAAASLTTEIFENLLDRYKSCPPDAEFSAEAMEGAYDHSRHNVSSDRTTQENPQLWHDPEDTRYERNLDLQRLRKKNDGGFSDREWSDLDPVLRPFGFHLLLRKGLGNQDAEDVYLETFAELARERVKDGKAPIESIVVFEEVIPLFSKMVQFRAIDWRRRQSALKNQPNTQSSFEDLTEREDGAMQFEDESADPGRALGALSFEEIYRQCGEILTECQWHLVFTVYVSQSATMGELCEDPEVLGKLGLELSHSISKKRRILNEALEEALAKLQKCLLS
ncbi:MAG: hypothetical protein P8M65_14910 [Roseibacillus sp.]|nr:hypothetical protein [Roseibacillus sp.]